jgi:glutaconate CoA-transferase subunit A
MNPQSLGSAGMARFLSLAQAVASLIRDGDTVAMEGFTHLIPFAAGRTRSSVRDAAISR